jgi:competence ComEA-like helix-hairpin-helix protein
MDTKLIRRDLGILALALCALPAMAQEFPDGAGKVTTLEVCSNCHDASVIVGHRQGRDEWTATIQKMIEAGAEGTPEQFKAVLDYLTKNFGPGGPSINVNKASAADLARDLGLTEKEAAAIVKRRTDNGAFKGLDDLKKVPDLDFKKIEAQKERLVF